METARCLSFKPSRIASTVFFDDEFHDRRLAQSHLQSFIDSIGVKIPLVDRVPYGWDLLALEEAVLEMIQAEGSTASDGDRSKIDEIAVIDEPNPPWLDLQVKGSHLSSWTVSASFGRNNGKRASERILVSCLIGLCPLQLCIGILRSPYQDG